MATRPKDFKLYLASMLLYTDIDWASHIIDATSQGHQNSLAKTSLHITPIYAAYQTTTELTSLS